MFCIQACLKTHWLIGTINPDSSAAGIKSLGRIRPLVGWFQRINDSTAWMVLVLTSYCGWYTKKNYTIQPINNTPIELNLEKNQDLSEDIQIEKTGIIENLQKDLDSLDNNTILLLDEMNTDISAVNADTNTSIDSMSEDIILPGANSLELDIENLEEENVEDDLVLKEVDIDLNLENNLETLQLKKPNQVYFGLYKEARNKAKLAKKAAIIAYLEAKNIKKTYLLENLDDSDSDFDAEIDEVSESELEGL